jgi:hypothetical protein
MAPRPDPAAARALRRRARTMRDRQRAAAGGVQTAAGLAPAKGVARGAAPAPVTPAPRRPGTPAPAARPVRNDWGDGKSHSISLATHRQHVEDKNPLYDPTTQLSGSALAGAARDLVSLEFDPQEAALKRELGNTTTQGTALAQRASDYSGQIAANDATIIPQQAAIKQMLDSSLGANATAAQQVIGKNLSDQKETAAADAALRGVSIPDATAGAAREAAAASNTVGMERQASQDAGALATQSYQQLASLSAGSRAQMGQEVQGQLLNRLANQQADVRSRQTDLGAQRGAATTKAALDLRQQSYENLITQKGLDIKTSELQAETEKNDAATKLAEQRIGETAKARRSRERIANANRSARSEADKAARNAQATREGNKSNKYGYTNNEWLSLPLAKRTQIVADANKKAGKGAAKMSAQAFAKRTRIDSMLADIGNDPKLKRHQYETGPRLVEILTKRGADPLEAQAAAEIARHGTLTPETEAKLKRAGIKIPTSWRGTPATGRDAQPG